MRTNVIKAVLTGSVIASVALHGATEDWANWTTAKLYMFDGNVSGSEVNVIANVKGATDTFIDSTPAESNGQLDFYNDFTDKTQYVSNILHFSTPVKVTYVRIQDIDYANNDFEDRMIIQGKDKNGNIVFPSHETLGAKVEKTNGGYESTASGALNDDDPDGFVTVDFNNSYITELNITYTNGDRAPDDPDGQHILIDSIDFDPIDTDGDGIPDNLDIDDDNDGILDAVEMQGTGNEIHGFFHVINGQLYGFDPINQSYTPIGETTNILYNAMGYDVRSGKLYAIALQDGNDSEGNSVARNDIVIIDRYSGKTKKADTTVTIDSYAADIYNGKFYARTNTNELTIWELDSNTTSTLSLSGDANWADFVILPDSDGTPYAYGMRTNDTSSGATDNTDLFRVNINDGTVSTVSFTVTTPDEEDLNKGWGATYLTKDNNGNYHMYAANNNGYIYEIKNFQSGTPEAVFTYKSRATSYNDGAGYIERDQYAVDTDNDGIPDYLDLDSDNDGIPDNVEAQTTGNYTAPKGTDSDGDGLDDAYDNDNNGADSSVGIVPVDTDTDGAADFIDTDTDDDGYTDCQEGLPDSTSGKYCPVDKTDVGTNGLVGWAESSDDYSDVNGKVDTPSDDLQNEVGDTSEVAYREITDTDGDGISNFKDLDDDGDGIPDAVEIQGKTGNVHGIFRFKDGGLYISDPVSQKLIQIGATDDNVNINALGFNKADGKLYAVYNGSNDYTDREGRTINNGDIVTVDRRDGTIHWYADNGPNSIAGAISGGKFYILDQGDGKTVHVFDIASKTFDSDIVLDDTYAPHDFVVYNNKLYGVAGNGNDSDYTDQNIVVADLSDGSITTQPVTLDGAGSDTDGSAALALNDNGEYTLIIANNAGGIYQIDDFDTSSPSVSYISSNGPGSISDAASDPDYPIEAADTDNDGIPDYLDLDSDNDGIPDIVEAQTTGGFDISDLTTDVDNDGIADIYDGNTSGAENSTGIVPQDTDKDGVPDYLDNDSDNDGYDDCDEGLSDGTNGKSCPVDGTDVGNNGLVSWAENNDTYNEPNGIVTDPDPTQSSQMDDEYSADNDAQDAYREFLCGNALTTLTAYNWKLISIPCDTGSLTVSDVFGPSLGTYGDEADFVIYEQTGNDDYIVTDSHKNTDKRMMAADDTLSQNKSYWIITDKNTTVTIPRTLSGLKPTPQADVSDVNGKTITDPDVAFTKVFDLDALFANDASNKKKYMMGNPFPYKFDVSRLYLYNHTNDTYYPLGDSKNDAYVDAAIYTHDSPDLTDQNISAGGGYLPHDAKTPGFSDKIDTMEGFFIIFKAENSENDNDIAIPLMTQYSHN